MFQEFALSPPKPSVAKHPNVFAPWYVSPSWSPHDMSLTTHRVPRREGFLLVYIESIAPSIYCWWTPPRSFQSSWVFLLPQISFDFVGQKLEPSTDGCWSFSWNCPKYRGFLHGGYNFGDRSAKMWLPGPKEGLAAASGRQLSRPWQRGADRVAGGYGLDGEYLGSMVFPCFFFPKTWEMFSRIRVGYRHGKYMKIWESSGSAFRT